MWAFISLKLVVLVVRWDAYYRILVFFIFASYVVLEDGADFLALHQLLC